MNCASARRRLAGAAIVLLTVGLAGCGPGGPPLGKVNGKVVANGQPVTGGGVVFAPASGDAISARGTINADGTFVLGTNAQDDGAAIGTHTVVYNPPPRTGQEEWDGYGTPPPEKISPYEGHVPKESTVEVKAGENDITIELVPGPPS